MTSEAALLNLCELIVDCAHSTPKWTDMGALVLRSPNIRGGRLDLSDRSYTDEEHYRQRSRRAELRAGDLVITREAPMGEVCMIPPDLRCCMGQRMVLLRPDLKKCDGRFLLYAIQSPAVQNQISWSEGTGSTVSNLRIPHLEALRIPTPSLSEQRAVAAVLGLLDDKIEQNRRTNQALEALARATFKAWFVDFEPIKAKAGGQASFPGISPTAFASLPDCLTDAPNGPVPQGWSVRPLKETVNLTMGQSPRSEFYNLDGDGLPFHQGVSDHGFRFPTRRVYCTADGRMAEAGDVLLSVRAPVGRINVADIRMVLGRDRASGGVVFTTIHKFTETHGVISKRANLVVMADEAHRSQYGFVEGGARWMREALPNATFVGFTGTPLTAGDRVTRNVFGEYADVYDIRQAVADGATVPIYYEPRIVKLTIDEAGAQEAETKIAQAAARDESGLETPESIRIPLEELYGAPERLERVAKFVVEHWEERRTAMEGKAMLVVMSRDIAVRLYDEIYKLRPGWHDDDDARGVVKVIMNEGLPPKEEGESEESYQKRISPLKNHGRTKGRRKELASRFKDPSDDFRLAIVVDMWLTGFDVPSAHTLYLDKPLAGHNLMQAIARVNRVYGEKPGGLVVDLIGLADPLADALATYANATGETDKPVKELQDEAIPAMRSAFEQLRAFFHDFNYATALEAEPSSVLRVYLGAIDHVLDLTHEVGGETGWQRFGGMVKRLATAFALAVPRDETRELGPHLAFFQRVAAMIRKRLVEENGPEDGQRRGDVDIDAAVRQVIGGAVDASEVIDLFAAAGLDAARLDILSDEFLKRVSALEQKNLALETLRKLLADQIKLSERSNLVQARKFREALEDAMLGYTNKQITTAQMIAQLLELAKWVREAKRHGQDLGLSDEETAFYDALVENGSAKEVMKSDQLRLMARELAEMVKKMPRLDWTERESVRADLRRKVRRLLAMYGYPPDLSEEAAQLVLKQAELSTKHGGPAAT